MHANNATVNILVYRLLRTCASIAIKSIPRSGIAESKCQHIANIP